MRAFHTVLSGTGSPVAGQQVLYAPLSCVLGATASAQVMRALDVKA